MNNYLSNYPETINRLSELYLSNPEIYFLVRSLLEDVRDEIEDMRHGTFDALADGVAEICEKKLTRRIEYLNKIYKKYYS